MVQLHFKEASVSRGYIMAVICEQVTQLFRLKLCGLGLYPSGHQSNGYCITYSAGEIKGKTQTC